MTIVVRFEGIKDGVGFNGITHWDARSNQPPPKYNPSFCGGSYCGYTTRSINNLSMMSQAALIGWPGPGLAIPETKQIWI